MTSKKVHKEFLLLWRVISLSLFLVFWIINNSVSLHSSEKNKNETVEKATTVVETEKIHTTKLYAWWDIMLSRGVWYYNRKNNWTMMFSWTAYNPIHEWCQDDCFLVFNLESLFSKIPNDSPDTTLHFAANTRNIAILERMKGNNDLYLSLANNHATNVGKDGVMFTRSFLEQENILYGGAGEDRISNWYNITFINRDTIRICLSSYSYDGATLGQGKNTYTIEKLEIWSIRRDVKVMRDRECDVKVANLHRGQEYRIAPTTAQRTLAREIIDSGIDLILWNHSHVPGLIESYHGSYIVYSMGNHIFDQDRWYKTCEKSTFDVIYDYDLDRCTVPTYVGMNLGFVILKENNNTLIQLRHVGFFGIKQGIQYPLDSQTKQDLNNILLD